MKKFLSFLLAITVIVFAACSAQTSGMQADSVHARESVENSEDEPESVITEVVFPAYQDGKNENDGTVYDLEPFVVAAVFPEGWQVRSPDTKSDDTFAFFTPMDIYSGDQHIGLIGYNVFTPYDSADIPVGDYYKTVYPELRLSSICRWNDYIPVKTTGTSETAVATVCYMKAEEIEKHPGAMPDVPVTEVPGILCYDKHLQAYIGIQFDENTVTEEQVLTIAESLEIRNMPQ